MPNWCITTYKIIGAQEELDDLHDKLSYLQELSEKHYCACKDAHRKGLPEPELPPDIAESGFGFFLGTIVKKFGGDYEKMDCCGCIVTLDPVEDEFFYFITETAWGEKNDVWDLVMRHYKTLKYYYLAEEPGNLHFVTNDEDGDYFPEMFYIYDSVNNQAEYPQDECELFNYMTNVLGVEQITSREELDKLLEEFDENNPDESLYYHEFARIPHQINRDDDGDLHK